MFWAVKIIIYKYLKMRVTFLKFGSVTIDKSRLAEEQKYLSQWVSILVIITQTTAVFFYLSRD